MCYLSVIFIAFFSSFSIHGKELSSKEEVVNQPVSHQDYRVRMASIDDVRLLEKLQSQELHGLELEDTINTETPWLCHASKLINVHLLASKLAVKQSEQFIASCESRAERHLTEALAAQSIEALDQVVYECPQSAAAKQAAGYLSHFYMDQGEFTLSLLYAQIFPQYFQKEILHIKSEIKATFGNYDISDKNIFEPYYDKLLDNVGDNNLFDKLNRALRHHHRDSIVDFFGGSHKTVNTGECFILDLDHLWTAHQEDLRFQAIDALTLSAQNYQKAAKWLVANALQTQYYNEHQYTLGSINKVGPNISTAIDVLEHELTPQTFTVDLRRITDVAKQMGIHGKDFAEELLKYAEHIILTETTDYRLHIQSSAKIELVASALEVILSGSLEDVGNKITRYYLPHLQPEDIDATHANSPFNRKVKKILTLLEIFKDHAAEATGALYILLDHKNPYINLSALEVLAKINLNPNAEQLAKVARFLNHYHFVFLVVFAAENLLTWKAKAYYPDIIETLFLPNYTLSKKIEDDILNSGEDIIPALFEAHRDSLKYTRIKKLLTRYKFRLMHSKFTQYLTSENLRDRDFALETVYLAYKESIDKLTRTRNEPKIDIFKAIKNQRTFAEFTRTHIEARLGTKPQKALSLKLEARLAEIQKNLQWLDDLHEEKLAEKKTLTD